MYYALRCIKLFFIVKSCNFGEYIAPILKSAYFFDSDTFNSGIISILIID